jgi:hypothetical protein
MLFFLSLFCTVSTIKKKKKVKIIPIERGITTRMPKKNLPLYRLNLEIFNNKNGLFSVLLTIAIRVNNFKNIWVDVKYYRYYRKEGGG